MESKISKNPLKTKKDLQAAFIQISEPLKKYYSEGRALLNLGVTGASYPDKTAWLEGFSRVLWGLAPFLAGGGTSDLEKIYLEGLKNGTNPEHKEYWGQVPSYDQRIVEMAAIGFAMTLVPEKFWNNFNEKEKNNFAEWLGALDKSQPFPNNWLFFRALTDLGMKTIGRKYDEELLEKTLAAIDSFYKGDGWYSDGNKPQYDYYVSFALHFYGLFYGKITGETKYFERAKLFAKDFIYWFSASGDALPFGRSLTYKFAQTAFWSAYIYAGAEDDLGVIKGIIMRHLRWWFKQPVFDRDGILSIGYAYPNLIMSEGYNSPGSQYWALKSFLILALPDNHKFWQAEEEPLPRLNTISVQKHPDMIISHMEEGRHIVALASGQYADFLPAHVESKYSKFAYSNIFGFSVSRSNSNLKQGAFDSMLALSEDGKSYRVRQTCAEVKTTENAIYSVWKPWEDVSIKTILIPAEDYHIRVHIINSERNLITAEGGFSAARDEENTVFTKNGAISAIYPSGCSGIIDLSKIRQTELLEAEVNTNLLHPRTVIPMLKGNINKGKSILSCAVLGTIDSQHFKRLWENPPEVSVTDKISIEYNGKVWSVNL